jgi:cytochrome c551/c552
MISRNLKSFVGALATLAVVIPVATRALEIQLPSETGAFKQATGAELANGQCLICHSVEYITSQPKMPRPFWKASVVKMQQKYGAQIQDSQIEAIVDYLVVNYGVGSNAVSSSTAAVSGQNESATQTSTKPTAANASQVAMKYACFGCHNASVKIIGPAYKDIAAKYKSDPDAFAKINEQIHKGGSGKWGPVIMPPFPQVTTDETKILADWILSLSK